MDDYSKRTWAQIDLDAVEHNFYEIKKHISSDTKLLCVLKADAYGHGAEFLVNEYDRLGADWFGVSNIDEALQLRKSGTKKPILIFGYTDPSGVEILSKNNISQALFSYEYAKKISDECKRKNIKVKTHIKIDTGMSRIGFFAQTPQESDESVKEIKKIYSTMPEIIIEGIFTHFSVADDLANNKDYTLRQYDNFIRVIDNLKKCGISIPIRHCCNSGGIISLPNMHMDMVRAGIILYGLHPSDEMRGKINLQPVMQLKTVVSQVKSVPAGTSVSYGRTYISQKQTKLASVTIGYADGYSIKFSNNAEMIIRGKRAPIAGRVCMDQLMLDVSDIDGVECGDEVTVFGTSGSESLSVDELAGRIGIINYEIICLIGKRVPRIYYKNGKIVARVSYI